MRADGLVWARKGLGLICGEMTPFAGYNWPARQFLYLLGPDTLLAKTSG